VSGESGTVRTTGSTAKHATRDNRGIDIRSETTALPTFCHRVTAPLQTFSVILAVASVATAMAMEPPQLPRIDVAAADKAAKALADSGFSGVVLIARGDSVLLHRGYGAAGHHADTSSRFWIGSMTKGFTAAAILALQERGRLSVHDTLGKFFRDVPDDKRRITVHELLTHTAGLSGSEAAVGVVARTSALRAIMAEPLAYAPGKGYRYINDDYQLLAAIVEVVSGRRWEDFVRSQLLNPAGMQHTSFWCAGQASIRGRVCDWDHRGSNGMSSTAGDLLRWTRALHGNGVLSAGSRASLEAPQIFVRHEAAGDVYYGYGVRVYRVGDRTTEVMHSGNSDDGNSSIARLIAPNLTVIVLSDAGAHAGGTWSSYVSRRLMAACCE
jgi:CubicO group peptidase (beta-lactamase class C family)